MSEHGSSWSFDLSVIIVSWNVKDYLRECIQSVTGKSGDLRTEIIVFDNASVDGTTEMLREEFPNVKVIESDENLGFGKGNNVAFTAAQGKFIALLNPDCVLLNDVFGLLVDILKERPAVGLAGPKLISPDNSVQYACARQFSTVKSEFMAMLGIGFGKRDQRVTSTALPRAQYDISQEVDCISGACMVLRRDILQNRVIFDQQYFMYAEDIDLCFETKLRGWSVFYENKAAVLHYGGSSSSQRKMDAIEDTVRSKYRFLSKRYGQKSGTCYLLMTIAILSVKSWFVRLLRFAPQTPARRAHWESQSERYRRKVRTARRELAQR